jgi:serine/threonine protein kinase
MEYFPSIPLGQWLELHERDFGDRRRIWLITSGALRHLYAVGSVHGDPHPGNILIQQAPTTSQGPAENARRLAAGVKLADLGASARWDSIEKLKERESRVIWKTARKLFSTEGIGVVLDVRGIEALHVVRGVDSFVEAFAYLDSFLQRRSDDDYGLRQDCYGMGIAIGEPPVFRLEQWIALMLKRGFPTDLVDVFLVDLWMGIRVAQGHEASTREIGVVTPRQLEDEYAEWRRQFFT